MGMIEDIMKALDRSDVWRELQRVPARMDALEQRVKELEEKLNGKSPAAAAEVCRFCGERAMRMTSSQQYQGRTQEHWQCGSCKKVETRLV